LPRPSKVGPRWTVVLAQAVEGGPALDGDAGRRNVGELDRVVLGVVDRVGQVETDLLGVDVERRDEPDVGDVVLAERDVHQTWDTARRVSVLVVLDALDEGRGAVAHAHDGYAYGTHWFSSTF